MIRSTRQDSNMTVSITAAEKKTKFVINSATMGQQMKLEFTSIPSSVRIEASGKGLVLVQVSSSYNIIPVQSQGIGRRRRRSNSPLSLDVISVNDTLEQIDLKLCPRSTSNETGMVIVQTEVPSGYEVDKTRLDATVNARTIVGLKLAEEKNNEVVLYFDELGSSDAHCTPLRLLHTSTIIGQATVYARIVDYYAPENTEWETVDARSAQTASTCDVCGSQCAGCGGSTLTAVAQAFVEDPLPTAGTTSTKTTTKAATPEVAITTTGTTTTTKRRKTFAPLLHDAMSSTTTISSTTTTTAPATTGTTKVTGNVTTTPSGKSMAAIASLELVTLVSSMMLILIAN